MLMTPGGNGKGGEKSKSIFEGFGFEKTPGGSLFKRTPGGSISKQLSSMYRADDTKELAAFLKDPLGAARA